MPVEAFGAAWPISWEIAWNDGVCPDAELHFFRLGVGASMNDLIPVGMKACGQAFGIEVAPIVDGHHFAAGG